jgi:hypothetical protein
LVGQLVGDADEQANTLEQLLRTKLDPRVEDWVARGRAAGTESTGLGRRLGWRGGRVGRTVGRRR